MLKRTLIQLVQLQGSPDVNTLSIDNEEVKKQIIRFFSLEPMEDDAVDAQMNESNNAVQKIKDAYAYL